MRENLQGISRSFSVDQQRCPRLHLWQPAPLMSIGHEKRLRGINYARTLSKDVLTTPKFAFLYSLNQLIYCSDLDQHDDHIVLLLNVCDQMSVPIKGNSYFRRRRGLIAVRLTIYVDHFYTILVSKSDPYRIPEERRGCSSWLLLHTLRACGDLNLINSDLTCWGEFDGARIATETKAGRPESKV
jgi:hypothetical protein